MTSLTGRKLALEELRRNFDNSYSSIDTLDGKLQSVLGFSSILIPLAGLVEFRELDQILGDALWIWAVTLFVIYVLIIGITFFALRPMDFAHPISSDWDEITKLYFNVPEEKALDQAISDHLEFIKRINLVSKAKMRCLWATMFLMVLEVLIIMGSISIVLL